MAHGCNELKIFPAQFVWKFSELHLNKPLLGVQPATCQSSEGHASGQLQSTAMQFQVTIYACWSRTQPFAVLKPASITFQTLCILASYRRTHAIPEVFPYGAPYRVGPSHAVTSLQSIMSMSTKATSAERAWPGGTLRRPSCPADAFMRRQDAKRLTRQPPRLALTKCWISAMWGWRWPELDRKYNWQR